jgi:hypothetical protein
MIGKREWIGGAIMVAAIVAAALATNRRLDVLDIANEPAATVEQLEERARERWWDWHHRREPRSEEVQAYRTAAVGKPEQMCADPRAVFLAKGLINDQYPSLAKLGPVLAQLEAARTDPDMFNKQWKNLEWEKQFHTSRLPSKDAEDELKRIDVRATKLEEQERQAKERAANPPAQQTYPDNQVIVSGLPYPIEYDRDLKRVACRIQYRITGPAYETINALQGNALSSAIYTVQPGQDDWIVGLLSASSLN